MRYKCTFVNLSILMNGWHKKNMELDNTNILLETPICSRKKKMDIAFVRIEIKSKAKAKG